MAVRTCFMPDYEVLGDFVRGSVSWEVPCPLWPTVCSVGRALLRRSPRGGTGMHDLLSLLTHTQQCEKSTVLTLSFSCRDKGLLLLLISVHIFSVNLLLNAPWSQLADFLDVFVYKKGLLWKG